MPQCCMHVVHACCLGFVPLSASCRDEALLLEAEECSFLAHTKGAAACLLAGERNPARAHAPAAGRLPGCMPC